jgi:hypothetical protein
LGGSPISADNINIIIDTSVAFNSQSWLRSYTGGGAFYDIPLSIYICGFEEIIA